MLYDREVMPAGTRCWALEFRVDWSHAGPEGAEAEGILGYVLVEHWAKERCWLGGGAARGLGWCQLVDLQAWRLDGDAYDRWVRSRRAELPGALPDVPVVQPTSSWCLRTLDVKLHGGEHRSEPDEAPWGLDMLAIAPHDVERAEQHTGDGRWARPAWVSARDLVPKILSTDRAILMEGDRPVLPGSSLREAMRHGLSRAARASGAVVQDPHLVQGKVPDDDSAGAVFGTVNQSSRLLIRGGQAGRGWVAARLHMHAEDEFSAGSYGSANAMPSACSGAPSRCACWWRDRTRKPSGRS